MSYINFARAFAWISIAAWGISLPSVAQSSELAQCPSVSTASQLRSLMRTQGVRKRVQIEERKDLNPMLDQAIMAVNELNMGCEIQAISEIRIHCGVAPWIAGYEVFVLCDDSPSPALSLYYDVNAAYLGSAAGAF